MDVTDVEDWRVVVVFTAAGFRTYLVLDDGVALVESVDVA